MANALLGSAKVLLLASCIGVPIRVPGGCDDDSPSTSAGNAKLHIPRGDTKAPPGVFRPNRLSNFASPLPCPALTRIRPSFYTCSVV
jgi:hypothetical protein